MSVADTIYERVKFLPEPLARRVLQFVDSLGDHQSYAESSDLIKAQSASLVSLWDNSEDKVWDDA